VRFWLIYLYHHSFLRWKPFDPARNWPDLGPRFVEGERIARQQVFRRSLTKPRYLHSPPDSQDSEDRVEDDRRDLDWATVLKRSFESYIRGERPNMYGEALRW
jgi:WD repeat and SOF domain-containing protein 1